jgi:hypothetical protein
MNITTQTLTAIKKPAGKQLPVTNITLPKATINPTNITTTRRQIDLAHPK